VGRDDEPQAPAGVAAAGERVGLSKWLGVSASSATIMSADSIAIRQAHGGRKTKLLSPDPARSYGRRLKGGRVRKLAALPTLSGLEGGKTITYYTVESSDTADLSPGPRAHRDVLRNDLVVTMKGIDKAPAERALFLVRMHHCGGGAGVESVSENAVGAGDMGRAGRAPATMRPGPVRTQPVQRARLAHSAVTRAARYTCRQRRESDCEQWPLARTTASSGSFS